MNHDLVSIRTVGGLLPADLIGRVVAGDRDLAGLSATDFHLVGAETPREAANRAWAYLSGAWVAYRSALEKLPEGDHAVGLTREKWLQPLLGQLSYGRVPNTAAGGIQVDDRSFAVSHLWEQVPMHLLGWGVELDKRTKGVPGAAERAPHAMVQELLNRTDDYLFGVVSNGRVLRLLRDSTSLSGQSFVEFDLEAMFDGEVFSDFAVLFLLLHQSRVEILTADAPASDCWLEKWRTTAVESGTRALGLLRDGVQQAISALGTGLVAHPSNGEFNRKLAEGEVSLDDFHRGLLRLVYRLLFLFVAEDRGVLLDPAATTQAATRYHDYFSTARLRRLALTRRGTRHGDLWQTLSLVIDALGRERGRPELGLRGLGGLFDAGPADLLTELQLPNDALLTAVRHLSIVQPKGQPKRTVDYRNLGAEELGSIYESLLELVPRHNSLDRTFSLEALAGNERKTSGSYYTPTSLIDLLLDEALDPLLDDAEKADHPEAALLAVTVCDPACGSGHFLVSAARRIAQRLATVRTGDVDPTPTDLQDSLHDVVDRCIYGVDLNPMAAELAKVSLWLEAIQPGRPLSFLDAHIKVGNALLGTTPALLAAGIPDAAYKPIEGDDKKHAVALKKRNRTERDAAGQGDLFDVAALEVGNSALRDQLSELQQAPVQSLADLHHAQQRYRDFQNSPELLKARYLADAWCAAFVQHKTPGAVALTHRTLAAIEDDTAPEGVTDLVNTLATQYRFFHWHLEFPDIYETPGGGANDTPAGWRGGFTAIIGNPPWERLKVQEPEFFSAAGRPDIASSKMTQRSRLISTLETEDPELFATYSEALRQVECTSAFLRNSGRFPLSGVGRDINTAPAFVETALRGIVRTGHAGQIVPSGIATDDSTKNLFAALAEGHLTSLLDFENRESIFVGVDSRTKFSLITLRGEPRSQEPVRFAFFCLDPDDARDRKRWIVLTRADLRLLNPNTLTCPIFRSSTHAELTLAAYRRFPVLSADRGEDLWEFQTRPGLFHMGNDAALFVAPSEASSTDVRLYEAKMAHLFNHRWANLSGEIESPDPTNPSDLARPRSYVPATEVSRRLKVVTPFLTGVRDITNATNERTLISLVLPSEGVGHNITLFETRRDAVLLCACFSTLMCDFISRTKLGGTHMSAFVLRQLPIPTPQVLEGSSPWDRETYLREWILPRFVELTFTAWDLQDFGREVGFSGPPFRWITSRREQLRSELEAALFHIYGVSRHDTEFILETFPILRRKEEAAYGEFRTKRLTLERYDAMQAAIQSGVPYETPLDPPPGHGPRHPEVP